MSGKSTIAFGCIRLSHFLGWSGKQFSLVHYPANPQGLHQHWLQVDYPFSDFLKEKLLEIHID